jgi:hypothetical protein
MNICPYACKWGINLRRPTQIYGTKSGEYVARFVDDVISFSKDPMTIMKDLEKHYIMVSENLSIILEEM